MAAGGARRWTWTPIAGAAALMLAWPLHPTGAAAWLVVPFLAAAVLAAVHHAEVIGHRVGEPFGSLLLAVAVTVIEVGLIVTLSLGQDEQATSLARDTVFAAFMLATNLIVGAALLAATLRGRVAVFNAEGTGAMLATLTAIAALCLLLPNFTASSPGPTFSDGQLVFAALAALCLYGLFVYVQGVRHREQFEPVETAPSRPAGATLAGGRPAVSAALLVVSLVAVVGLAKVLSPSLESAIVGAGLPVSLVGVLIAALILMPEGITAVRAARADNDDVQRSFNLAYGSAMASIGLTVPVVAALSLATDRTLLLGLSAPNAMLLALTVAVSVLTVTPGRATLLQAGVHLTIGASFVVLAVMP